MNEFKNLFFKALGFVYPALVYFSTFIGSTLAMNFLVFLAWLYIPATLLLLILIVIALLPEVDEVIENAAENNHIKQLQNVVDLGKRRYFLDSVYSLLITSMGIVSIFVLVAYGHILLAIVFSIGECISLMTTYLSWSYAVNIREYIVYYKNVNHNDNDVQELINKILL